MSNDTTTPAATATAVDFSVVEQPLLRRARVTLVLTVEGQLTSDDYPTVEQLARAVRISIAGAELYVERGEQDRRGPRRLKLADVSVPE